MLFSGKCVILDLVFPGEKLLRAVRSCYAVLFSYFRPEAAKATFDPFGAAPPHQGSGPAVPPAVAGDLPHHPGVPVFDFVGVAAVWGGVHHHPSGADSGVPSAPHSGVFPAGAAAHLFYSIAGVPGRLFSYSEPFTLRRAEFGGSLFGGGAAVG